MVSLLPLYGRTGYGDGGVADLCDDGSEERRCTQEEENAVHLRPIAVIIPNTRPYTLAPLISLFPMHILHSAKPRTDPQSFCGNQLPQNACTAKKEPPRTVTSTKTASTVKHAVLKDIEKGQLDPSPPLTSRTPSLRHSAVESPSPSKAPYFLSPLLCCAIYPLARRGGEDVTCGSAFSDAPPLPLQNMFRPSLPFLSLFR